MTTFTFVTYIPPRPLWPNARPHYMEKAREVKSYRSMARFNCESRMNLLAGRSLKKHVPMDRATAQVTFYFDSKRRRDPDNALAAMKAAFDGMVDAKIIADDSRLVHLPVIMLIDRESPRVVIEVTGE